MFDLFDSRGFLPPDDPLVKFPSGSPYELLDTVGQDLPSLLLENDCREYLCSLKIPVWPKERTSEVDIPALRLYYVRLGFIVSGYVNQTARGVVNQVPQNLAIPFVQACELLKRPPILSYDGYALYNWKRFDKSKPIALGNIDTIQNFVHLYDEHWFILIHVEIEALAAEMLESILLLHNCGQYPNRTEVDDCLFAIKDSLDKQTLSLKRIPEKMSPELYFKDFRPYIRFFEDVTYEGVSQEKVSHRGETGAQSSIMPTLVALLKIPHTPTALTNFLHDMRRYMPHSHRGFIQMAEQMPAIKQMATPELFDAVLESMAKFREIHYGWATQYIDDKVSDPRGTGGTPYMRWLKQLIDETRAHKFSNASV